jgi:hypothetical protein
MYPQAHSSEVLEERQRYIIFVGPDESRATRLFSAFYPELNDFKEVKVLSFTALQLLEILSLIALSSTVRLFQTKIKIKISRIKSSRMKMKLGMMWEVPMPTLVISDSKLTSRPGSRTPRTGSRSMNTLHSPHSLS